MDPVVMAALLAAVSGSAGTAAVTGFFNNRTSRLQHQTTTEAALWKRIADMELQRAQDSRDHNTLIREMEASHKAEVKELKAEVRQLESLLQTKDKEILQLQGDLRVAHLEIQVIRIQQQTGAGTLQTQGQAPTHSEPTALRAVKSPEPTK